MLLLAAVLVATRFAVARPLSAAAIATADEYSARAADEILHDGGNAVDAAVAVAFVLAVTYPEAGNLGGGGFMTLYMDGHPAFLDYRETAPKAASPQMYADADSRLVGCLSAGVPGTVRGMYAAHQRYGRLPWRKVLEPAIRLARDGFTVDSHLAERSAIAGVLYGTHTDFVRYFGRLQVGQLLRQPELAATLQRIAARGPADFYEGETAHLLVAQMRRGKGIITLDDLRRYEARWRTPIEADWNGLHVITAPPPSSGGIGLVQLLRMKAALHSLFEGVALNSPQYVHLLAEMEKRVFADRAAYLGDPDVVDVPVRALIDEAYIQRRAREVNPSARTPTDAVRPGLALPASSTPSPAVEPMHTTHFSIVDEWGNAVSNTYTINTYFGSGVVVEGAGFILNNEMDDFAAAPNVGNTYGVVGGTSNAIAPYRRMLSSMCPTILTRNGDVALVIGTPGGSRIFTSIFQVITNLYDFHLSLPQAVAQIRVHHQLLPADTIFSEPERPIAGELARALIARGYRIEVQGFDGDIEAVGVDGDEPLPVSDPRGRGVALKCTGLPVQAKHGRSGSGRVRHERRRDPIRSKAGCGGGSGDCTPR